MQALEEELKTIDDIYALPDGVRAELIDGVIYDMATPTISHQRLLVDFSADIINYIRSHKGECEAFVAPFAVFLFNDEYNYVEPDIAVICDKDKLDDKGCHGAPDFIIEIVSPSSINMDYMIKLFKYRSAGVKEYWIADPMKKVIRTYLFDREETQEYSFSEEIPVGIYNDDLKLKVY